MAEFLITFRECLEASLIVGILYTFLVKENQKDLLRTLRTAVIVSIGASILVAFLFTYIDVLIEQSAYQNLFE